MFRQAIGDLSKKAPKAARRQRRPRQQTSGSAVANPGGLDQHHELIVSRMANPHNRAGPKVGLPRFPAGPSFKARGWVDFTMFAGNTNGFGFVAINPAVGNNSSALIYSSSAAAYLGTAIDAMNSAAVGTSVATFNNLPYAQSALNVQNLRARVVSVGLTLEYIGTMLNENGFYYTFADPNNADVTGDGIAEWSSRAGVVKRPIKKGVPVHLTLLPSAVVLCDYSINWKPWNQSDATTIGGVMISDTAGGAYRVCATIDVEYQGTTADSNATPNPVVTHPIDVFLSSAMQAKVHHVANPGASAAACATKAVSFLRSAKGRKDVAMGASLAAGLL